MAVAALRKEAILSPENSPISGSPLGAKRARRAPAAKSSIGQPALTRVLSDVGNVPQGDIFSPTRTSPSKAPKRQVTEEEAVEPVPWMYIRKYDVESAKMTYYAQQNGIKITKKQIADTRPVRATEALRVARDNDVLIVADADGKVQRLNPGGMTDARLKRALISSRHDAMRAPAYRYGKTLVVGYNEAVNEEVIFGENPAVENSEQSKKAKKE